MENQGFYLGRVVDRKTGKTTADPLLYDPQDLTTHAVVVGMTGSGKTGLCIDLLEEAALKGLPALMIDPKGDITNALLHFPDLAPADFLPWVNADQARREGKELEQAAAEAAQAWKEGLAQWGIKPDRLAALRQAARFAVFTPGSDSGIPVSILASFNRPDIPWDENRELLREKISATVTAVLGLVGLTDIDPVRSREHILLSNILENAWSKGQDLDLSELILQTQTPPFAKLGVFDVNTFFPEKDRFELAMLLNNILAAPSFQVWIEGQPLDIPGLLYTPEGKPRHSVFYIAHLSDSERMFFVTLLFSAVEAWMRSQSGTNDLRALLYFDEIFGYMPPTANPSAKQPMLRMLKQARAFGVGLVLVTQNPVDLDYKGLSNTGSWFIGKLQTDRDKQRLLDGLEGASPGIERAAFDRMISGLGKRVFLLHNVHARQPQLFQTRWAMNYLAGPLTRAQIPALNQLAGAEQGSAQALAATTGADGPAVSPAEPVQPQAAAPAAVEASRPEPEAVSRPAAAGAAAAGAAALGSVTRPAVPGSVAEFFLPNNLSFTEAFQAAGRTYPPEAMRQGLLYRPVLLAQASIRFLNRSYDLDYELQRAALVTAPDRHGRVRWEDYPTEPVQTGALDAPPDLQARFASLEAPLSEAKTMAEIQRDFLDWSYQTSRVSVRANETLKVFAGPEVSQAEFRRRCSEAAQQKRQAELEKVAAAYEKKIAALDERLAREQRELAADESDLSHRKIDEYTTHAETLLGLFGRRRRSLSKSIGKRRMAEQAEADVRESKETIAELQAQIAGLQKEKEAAELEVNDRWSQVVEQESEIAVTPAKKDVLVDLFGVAWFPFYVVRIGEELVELPGHGIS